MDQAANQSGNNTASGRQMGFAGPKIKPTVVTSAKAAINARYAEQAKQPASQPTMSAREAMNNVASHSSHDEKAASSLHQGKIQRNIERSQLSASALLRRARSPRPSEEEIKARDSFDPLAGRRLPETQPAPRKDNQQTSEIPVVRTSLKLGASKPKPKPVVLPPNARMARVARPMNRPRPATQASTLLSRRPLDAQIVPPKNTLQATSTKSLSSGKPELPMPPKSESSDIAVQIISSAKKAALPAKPAPIPVRTGRGTMDFKPAASRMRPPTPAPAAPNSAPLWPQPAQAAQSATRPAAPRPAKFRPAPKGYARSTPAPMPADNSYVISAPPKINLAHPHEQTHVSNLEDYYAPRIKPEDTEPTKTEAKKRAADNNRYALGGDSPFLKSVNVEKRPLSANAKPRPVAAPVEKSKSNKGRGARKNVYAKKGRKSDSDLRRALPERPTVIIPASRRSKVPLFILIVVTVILGAVVGAAAYLCFFQ